MERSENWTIQICVTINGEEIPLMRIEDHRARSLVCEEEKQRYIEKLLCQISGHMSRYTQAHPECFEKGEED